MTWKRSAAGALTAALLLVHACSSSDSTDKASNESDSGVGGTSAVGDAASDWPAPTPPADRTPCPADNCWMNAPVLSGACGNATVNEDFSTGLYNTHRYPLSAQAGLKLELTLDVAAGSWNPAIVVLAADGTTLYDGEIALVGGPVSIQPLASGKNATTAKVAITALVDTPLDVFVTSWSVIDGDFAPAMPSDAAYALNKSAECPASDAVCPIDPTHITSFDSGFFTSADSDDPNAPNYNPYKRDDRVEHLGYDLAAPLGTPVVATQSGNIIAAVTAPAADDLCGKSINLAASSGVTFRYCHLSVVSATSGPVQAGQVLGEVGKTGNANYTHLHFTYLDAPNVIGVGTIAQKSVKVNAYVDGLCQ